MCGIIGKMGLGAPRFVISGLKTLEYRGYDSSGIAVALGDAVFVQKGVGTIDRVVYSVPNGVAAIGHTRWATHGGVTDFNAHPHLDCSGQYAVVHNGIIENHGELRGELVRRGHVFSSETDSEVIVHLFEEGVQKYGDGVEALRYVLSRIRGQYAFAILSRDGRVYVARKGAPLLVAKGKDGVYVSSDPVPLVGVADEVYRLADGSYAVLSPDGVQIFGEYVPVPRVDARRVELGSHRHYMEKEIFEQPRAVKDTLDYLRRENVRWELDGRIHLVAAGTSYHAALYGEYLLRKRGYDAQAFIASEYEYWKGKEPDYVIAISQSGETEDVLSILRNLDGPEVYAITNTPGSTIEEYSDHVVYTRAGPEVGVAATKTYTTQLTVLAHLFSDANLSELPGFVGDVLESSAPIARTYAKVLSRKNSAYFLGRGLDVVTAKEGALKLKEIAYIHAEAYPAGESKHGPIALIESGFPVFFTASKNMLSEIEGNVQEMRARGAEIVMVTDGETELADVLFSVPNVDTELFPILSVPPWQLIAYYTAVERGVNPDRPRNLAKSVTVK